MVYQNFCFNEELGIFKIKYKAQGTRCTAQGARKKVFRLEPCAMSRAPLFRVSQLEKGYRIFI